MPTAMIVEPTMVSLMFLPQLLLSTYYIGFSSQSMVLLWREYGCGTKIWKYTFCWFISFLSRVISRQKQSRMNALSASFHFSQKSFLAEQMQSNHWKVSECIGNRRMTAHFVTISTFRLQIQVHLKNCYSIITKSWRLRLKRDKLTAWRITGIYFGTGERIQRACWISSQSGMRKKGE